MKEYSAGLPSTCSFSTTIPYEYGPSARRSVSPTKLRFRLVADGIVEPPAQARTLSC